MRRIKIDGGIILILVIVAVLAATGIGVAMSVRTDELSERIEAGGTLGVVLIVTDEGLPLFAEALLYNPVTNRGALFDIPPDLGQMITGLQRVDSIDTAYPTDGRQGFADRVAEVLGTDVPLYIDLDLAQFSALVDLVDGVPIFLADIPNEGEEATLLPNGDAVLDGAKATQYITLELPGEDRSDAVARRQRFSVALLNRIGERSPSLAHPRASRVFESTVDSNMERQSLVSLAIELGDLAADRVISRQIEGTFREVEIEGERKTLLFPHQDGRWLRESVRQVVENLRSEDVIRDENIVIRIEILNGTSVTGLARRTAELYRSYGFDVVTIGNYASSDVEQTTVIDRVGNEPFAERTADIIRAQQLRADPDAESAVDVTIILGADFDGRYVR